MATPDFASCLTPDGDQSELLPLSPFNALHYHFGMLLGEDDFKTDQGYHRGKMRLHNAWLHREGVVWGFKVTLEQARNEILVTPGLALDAAGHELHLEGEACLNVGEWFEKHKEDPEFTINAAGDSRTFDAHVIIRFKACLSKQVPALMEPCNNAGTSTAYSRVFETVEILLLPNLAGPTTPPYHRLRLLFGIDAPDVPEGSTNPTAADKIVIDEIARIRALPIPEQPAEWLKAFHRFAALDEIALKPTTTTEGVVNSVFPGQEDATVLLANLSGITVEKTADSWKLTGGTVDTSVRPSHVATTTIQDLLCAALSSVPRATAPVAVGPRVTTTTIEANQIVLDFDRPLQSSSVRPEVFSVSVFRSGAAGWVVFTVTATLDGARQKVTLAPDPSGPPDFGIGLARVIARGTGPTPLLGDDNLPLAGSVDDKPAPEGRDYVLMRRKES